VKDQTAAPPDASPPRDRTAALEAGNRPSARRGSTSTTAPEAADDPAPGSPIVGVDLAGLSVAGLTRRRVGWIAAGLVAVWIVAVFARQVGDATAATQRAAQMAADNAALAAEVEALQREVALIIQPEFVGQQARSHGLGEPREIPFVLDSSVPPPVDGAPGSASARLGAAEPRQTPLEAWLSLLFGPGDQ
jgi:cell division protein FtsB